MARAVAILSGDPSKQQQILCLPPSTGELPDTGGVIVASPALPVRKRIEHAGHIYQQKVIRAYSKDAPQSDDESTSAAQPSEASTPTGRPPTIDAASALRSKMAVGSDDLYELLELGDLRWHATADDIKKNFRRISLTYHPDKISHLGEEARANSESHFKAVMKAYDILSDKKKRAAYDSIDDVDDSIPSERDATSTPARFYSKFGACFALNARWSVSDRVPELGDDNTAIELVEKFYDFWYGFKSWRDFSFDLEYDTDQAECREEKRWMERQNAKHVKGKKAEEHTRIRKLVDLAYKHDPRLTRVRNEAKAKKDAKRLEKQKLAEARVKAEQEKKEREVAEAEQKAAEEKLKRAAAKKDKESAKKVMRKSRQKLRAVGRDLNLNLSDRGNFMLEEMCLKGTVESIGSVSDLLGALDVGDADANAKSLHILECAFKNPQHPLHSDDLLNGAGQDDRDEGKSPACDGNSAEAAEPKENEEEQQMEPKPNGVSQEASKESSNTESDSKKKDETVWTPEEISLLSKGVAKFPGGTRDRWNRLAHYIGTKTADEVLVKVNESRRSKAKKVAPMGSTPNQDSKAFERFQEKKKGKPVVPHGQEKVAQKVTPAAKPAPSTKGAQAANGAAANGVPSQPPNKFHFTPKEQSCFEAALKKFSAAEGDARWKKVSNAVGRNPSECQQRFNELIVFYRARKQAS